MYETHISEVYPMILVTVSIIMVREFIGSFKIFLQKYIQFFYWNNDRREINIRPC